MNNSKNIIKVLSKLLESSALTSQDMKKELRTRIDFQRDYLIDKLRLVSRDEFDVLKKLVEKQNKKISDLSKKKTKKAKKL
tara:strand:+ start:978 stop:1220 length:243 start_codon:yes stop_codon:yes gene_type:complete